MTILAGVACGLLALLHVGFAYLEAVLWATPTGRRIFGTDVEFAQASRVLAANQGLYNLFLAAGLVWGALSTRTEVQVFFAACVLVAGAVGALTVSRRILWVQAVPGLVTLVLALLAV
ncbi:DUF1304 domain-containing protein [Nocardioides bruguierae]|uniref:DUF1304 domain-containing protein n=1 Tax=Nocardioides bruguierae TaxID=2945102 RepID=A0A9X2IG02_9ACTN|nr:DUF1304 domain-containing protein [Nocardioides bruguierae]MCM0622371.1 DUF1304 domain-containing protein [Nocardioides bruguierae]